ncbi:hypothetical protein F2S72_01600 [Pseudomonas syringae pv. actinidiae]|nr:hypothetical protein [Pseudomonas syringae pv. actinidiae]
MSRHYIVLPVANNECQIHTLTSAAVVCGYDRLPNPHYFCNVSESLNCEHIDEPIWASILDPGLSAVTSADGFDKKLASMGIALPLALKDELRRDWSTGTVNREVYWRPDGTIERGEP